MSILANIIEVLYFLILLIVFIMGVITFINYFNFYPFSKGFKKSVYSDWLKNSGVLISDMNDCAEDLKKIDNPDLKPALEVMNRAISNVLTAQQLVSDLNYPIDDELE